MINKIKTFISIAVLSLVFVGPIAAVALPSPAYANTVNPSCEDRFLLIPPWYRGLTQGQDCLIQGPATGDGIAGFITKIALNIIEMVVIIVGYIAVFFIIFGGFRFLTGGGDPGAVEKARKSITNAVIGLVIALSAVAVVNFIFANLVVEIIP